MDDSNNEPSVALSCGGDGSSALWHLRRKLTLGADCLREQLWVENLAKDGQFLRFEVSEWLRAGAGIHRGADPETLRLGPTGTAPGEAGDRQVINMASHDAANSDACVAPAASDEDPKIMCL